MEQYCAKCRRPVEYAKVDILYPAYIDPEGMEHRKVISVCLACYVLIEKMIYEPTSSKSPEEV
jgi:hypothetical protein